MATVVSISEIGRRFQDLGWTNLSVPDIVDSLKAANIPAASMIAYLDAALVSPAGFNDQTIAGCLPADATKITNALKNKGVEAV
jgi:hypothetical protein